MELDWAPVPHSIRIPAAVLGSGPKLAGFLCSFCFRSAVRLRQCDIYLNRTRRFSLVFPTLARGLHLRRLRRIVGVEDAKFFDDSVERFEVRLVGVVLLNEDSRHQRI